MNKNGSFFIAGHKGLVGSAIVRRIKEAGYSNLVVASREQVNLLDQAAVHSFFSANRIEYVVIAAAKVGGIHANQTQQADFLYENLMIAANVIHAAAVNNVAKLLFLGSSCIYPRLAPQPIPEDALLTGPLESTNEGYAIAKIAGLKLCEMYQRQYGKNFISAMPTNLYGPGDNFHPTNSHVVPGMMRRFHEAKISGSPEVVVWGTGTPKREFLHVDDLSDALLFLMEDYNGAETINVGSGQEFSIRELAELMKEITGFNGRITFDNTKPDGTPRKAIDSSRIRSMGWRPKIQLEEGLSATYEWALKNKIF